MSTIDISRNHSLGKETAKTRANELLGKMKDSYGIKGTWNGDVFQIDAPAKGSCTVSDTAVRIEIALGMMMRPLKGKIETRITEELEKALK